MLQEAARVVKPGGKIVLLEHGRRHQGDWMSINKRLDEGAPNHKRKWGCWWNRDILSLVYEVRGRVPQQRRVFCCCCWLS